MRTIKEADFTHFTQTFLDCPQALDDLSYHTCIVTIQGSYYHLMTPNSRRYAYYMLLFFKTRVQFQRNYLQVEQGD